MIPYFSSPPCFADNNPYVKPFTFELVYFAFYLISNTF